MAKIWQILKDINELIVFKHSLFALPFIITAAMVASNELNGSLWPGWWIFTASIIAAVSARNYAMAANRYLDEDIDRPNPRCANRPSVDGRIGRKNLLIFITINAVIFIAISCFINSLAGWLSVPILAVLGGYSFFKRFSSAAHLVLGVCLGLSPIAGNVAVSGEISLWAALLGLGVAFWVAGFDILYSLQDIEYDKNAGLFSVPAIYGDKAAMAASALFHAIAVLFWLLFAWAASLGVGGIIAAVLAGVILYFEHKIVRKDFSKIDRAFFTLNGYLGIGFMVIIGVFI